MKFFKFLFSGILMGILLIVFAVVIGYATFIENDYDATTARMLVYNARWFEILIFLMVVNFSGMIFTRKLYQKSQLNVLIIHLALIIIIVGAALTRYIGFEGQIHIRNGQTTNEFYSTDTYLNVDFNDGQKSIAKNEKVILSGKRKNILNKSFTVNHEQIDITILSYYPNAVETVVQETPGTPFINMIVGGQDGRHEIYIKEGESASIHGVGFSFGDTTNENNIQIIRNSERLFVKLPDSFNQTHVVDSISAHGTSSNTAHDVDVNTIVPSPKGFSPLNLMSVHNLQNTSFIVKEYLESAVIKFTPATDASQEGKRVVNIKVNNIETALELGKRKSLKIGDIEVNINVGLLKQELPFSLKLNEFQLERYPGSNSPSSFASDIVLIDESENIEKPYRIFMNNILEYKGYRFYQSSYDQDEKGTVLSVNHDYWGTLITYIGYFLLFGSLIFSFFTRKTRFKNLLHQFKEVHKERKKLLTSLLIILLSVFGSQKIVAQDNAILPIVEKEHAAAFGKLQLQNQEGRVLPINTMATQVLVKMHKKSSYNDLTADQVFIEMISNHAEWQDKPLIIVNDPSLKTMLGIEGNYARFTDFIDPQGQYRLKGQVDRAYIKKPALRTKYDKELLNVNERVNICYMVLNQSLLKIFPLPNNSNNNWVTPAEFKNIGSIHSNINDSMFIAYLQNLQEAKLTNNYSQVNETLASINNYQKEIGQAIILSDRKINLEIFYNKINIFKRLFPVYLMLGLILVVIFFIQIFKPSLEFKIVTKIFFGILFLAFITQTLGIILRWHISGHAPWSNGYESMIYISWVTMLAGLIFMKKSPITLALTALLAGITLLTAHMSWMNPEITNLVPVLKSYWLTIHVATITASYGFLGLGTMLAFLNLCIMIFRNPENQIRVNLTLRELSLIIEMTLIVGLILLIIGNFLGGIWANESWGRYWGWDPKETWTLVTVIVYSFILHMGLIPSLKSSFSFNFMSMIGFSTVIMTYFGVNYYLSGLHSYAQGDPVPVPTFVYYTLLVLAIVSILAAINDYKLKLSNKIRSELAAKGAANS